MRTRTLAAGLTPFMLASCAAPATSLPTAAVVGYRIVNTQGGALSANAGDALPLGVVQVLADGTTANLPTSATVAWSGPPMVIAAKKVAGKPPSQGLIPGFGQGPTAVWIDNPVRPEMTHKGMLYVLDAGTRPNATVDVNAVVSGITPAGSASAIVPIGPASAGDASRGKKFFANECAMCHDPAGQGTRVAPEVNAGGAGSDHPGVAADPNWNAALFAMAMHSGLDNKGVALEEPMQCLQMASPLGRTPEMMSPYAGQDLIDVWAWLKTQTKRQAP